METLDSLSDHLAKTKCHLSDMMQELIETQNKLADMEQECKLYQTRFERMEKELENLRQSQNGFRANNSVTGSSQASRRTVMQDALANTVRKPLFPEIHKSPTYPSPPHRTGMAAPASGSPVSHLRPSVSGNSRSSPAPSRMGSALPLSETSGEIRTKMEEIKREYNSLEAIGEANEQRLARNAFIQKHGVVGLICTNSQARMGNPSLKPEFGEAGSPQRGDLWAVPLGNSLLWAVMPRQNLNYESQRNNSGGLGEIFDSNFESGTYSRITLASPAIFQRESDGWVRTPHKGRIVLAR